MHIQIYKCYTIPCLFITKNVNAILLFLCDIFTTETFAVKLNLTVINTLFLLFFTVFDCTFTKLFTFCKIIAYKRKKILHLWKIQFVYITLLQTRKANINPTHLVRNFVIYWTEVCKRQMKILHSLILFLDPVFWLWSKVCSNLKTKMTEKCFKLMVNLMKILTFSLCVGLFMVLMSDVLEKYRLKLLFLSIVLWIR